MENQKKNNILDRIWDSFASVKMAIVVFALIGLTSIVGTIVEQRGDPEKNIKIISSIVGEGVAPGLYDVLDSMGFMDMYRSWWFVTLLMMFNANLLICSLDRLPKAWKLVKEPLKPLAEEDFPKLPIKKELRLKSRPEKIKETVAKALSSAGFKDYLVEEIGGRWQAYSRKGRYSRLGVYITHLSMIVIMLGALIGIFYGFKGTLNLPEGATYTVAFKYLGFMTPEERQEQRLIVESVQDAKGNVQAAAASLGVSEQNMQDRMKTLGVRALGFGVTCKDFEVEFYGNSDMPKEYKSLLSITDFKSELLRKWIEVNEPLKYNGYTFYQSSYGLMGNPSSYVYMLRAISASGESKNYNVKLGETIEIPGTGITASVTDFNHALSFDQSGKPFSYAELMNNPAVRLKIIENGKENSKWVLRRFPATWTVSGSNTIELVDVWGAQFTGLQVRNDPGVWIVYLGCLLMSVGLYMSFFITDRRIWVSVSSEKGAATVLISATSNRGKEGFERKIDSMAALLREGGK